MFLYVLFILFLCTDEFSLCFCLSQQHWCSSVVRLVAFSHYLQSSLHDLSQQIGPFLWAPYCDTQSPQQPQPSHLIFQFISSRKGRKYLFHTGAEHLHSDQWRCWRAPLYIFLEYIFSPRWFEPGSAGPLTFQNWGAIHGMQQCRISVNAGRSTRTTLSPCWSSSSSSMNKSYWLTLCCWWRILSSHVTRWSWPHVAPISG